MNLLFILPEFEPNTSGGICTYYKNLIQEFIGLNKYHITVIQGSAFESPGGQSVWNGINIHYLDYNLFQKKQEEFSSLNIFPELQNHVASAWAMYEMAQQINIKFDRVICTDWGLGFIPWILNQEVPVDIHLHGSIGQIDHYEKRPGLEFWSDIYLQIESDLFNYAQNLVTHSKQNQSFWTDRLVDQKKFNLIPPIFPIASTISNKNAQEKNLYTGLVLARIQFWKGPIELCEAIRLLSKAQQNKLKIYWAGRDTRYADKKISMNAYLSKTFPEIWGKIIVPIGVKTQDEINTLLPEIDFGLVPSNWDMFNMTAVEHLIHEKPLIVSKNAGVSDFLENSKSIWITDQPSSIADALGTILDLPKDKLQASGKQNKEIAYSIFANPSIIHQHEDLFEQTDAIKYSNLLAKYKWLRPQSLTTTNAKVALLKSWPLKKLVLDVLQLTLDKIKKNNG